VEQNLNLANL